MTTQDGCATAEWGWEREQENQDGTECLLAISCARFILGLEGVPQLWVEVGAGINAVEFQSGTIVRRQEFGRGCGHPR